MIPNKTTIRRLGTVAVVSLIALAAGARQPVSFTSTDTVLENTFNWARDMAMSYVHDGSDPVGLWYEAALPGRDAFCMRDLSHQVVAAEILGLGEHNANMLRKVAEGISESKDWCSFWEIDKFDRPAPCDFGNDKEFWYNLPANFDVMRACREAYEWTGDSTYLFSPEFVNFYQRTAHDYAERWCLTPDSIMGRPRFMNTPEPFDRRKGFHTCRGLPSYAENFSGITVAIDLIGAIMTGYEAYEFFCLQENKKGEAEFARSRAEAFRGLMEGQWWDSANSRYNTYYKENGEFHRGEGIPYLLLIEALREPERAKASVADVLSRGWNVENLSAFPVFLYRLGYYDDAERILASLPTIERNDYPEVSYGAVEGIVCGAMGIRTKASESSVATCHRSNVQEAVSVIDNLPFNGGEIAVRHSGRTSSVFTNNTAKSIQWCPAFVGKGKICDAAGKELSTSVSADVAGNDVSTACVTVLPGASLVVEFSAAQ